MTMQKDVGMNVKMNQKCFPEIIQLSRGERVDEGGILAAVDFVNHRYDCADFRVLPLIKTYMCYRDLLSQETVKQIKDALLGFKYWLDEPGIDGMCYWSENHQLIFHTAAYLAGEIFPEDVFSNSGETGREKQLKAAQRIRTWLEQKFAFGMIEWLSNTYYEEDVAPLCLLIEHAPDHHVRERATIILDLLLLDMAMHSFEGFFVGTSGRCYEVQKRDPRMADVNDILKHAFGILDHPTDQTKLSTLFLIMKGYEVPSVFKKIARSQETMIIRQGMGHDLKEVKTAIYPHDFDHLGMYFWQMEAFTHPESIEMTMAMFQAWKLETNNFLHDLKMVQMPILRKLHLLPFLVKVLNPATQGVAIQRANIYTYRTKHFLLSSQQRYHPGEFGDQQHLWQLTLPEGLTIFSTHPGSPMFQDAARNFSPSYWVGNGINPDSRQHENVLILDYHLRQRRGFLESKRQYFVHFHFPFHLFDEVIAHDTVVYARKTHTAVAIFANRPHEVGDSELIYRGKRLCFAVVVEALEHGDFDAFQTRYPATAFSCAFRRVAFQGTHDYLLNYNRDFQVDHQVIEPRQSRYDVPFIAHTPHNNHLSVRYEGAEYEAHFTEAIRKMKEE
jgi:hypothetical protein